MMRKVLVVVLVVVLAAGGWLAWQWQQRPSLEAYAHLYLPPADEQDGLRVTWLGVSTLLIEDGETAIMTDGFFSRPGLLRVALTRIAPDPERIRRNLARAGVDELAAVIVLHSHYDHAMDAPVVAEQTGAVLVGSESTANVGRGLGLDESRIRVVEDGDTLRFGDFEIRFAASRHVPHGQAMGVIDQPLAPPVRASNYLEGGSWSVRVGHPQTNMLVQGSAGFVPDALADWSVDVVWLGIGLLSQQSPEYMAQYWREMVTTTGAQRVIPFHWDDFFRDLEQPLIPFPTMVDDFDATMQALMGYAENDGVELRLVDAWQPVEPLAE